VDRTDVDRLEELGRRGIAACLRRDAREVEAVFLELTASLDFTYEGAARRLADLYRANAMAARRRRFRPALCTFRLLVERADPDR
jgi:hypothetical protein